MNARELTNQLAALLRKEQSAMADFLLALADFDANQLWRDLGHTSLFYYLHRELGLSKGAAHYRKVAADLVQRFPDVIEPLRDGRLCITSIVELAKVLTPENRAEVLPRFFHRSKREAMAVSAEIRPAEAPPHRAVVTAVRAEAPPLRFEAPSAASPDLHHLLVQPVELPPPANEPCMAPSSASPARRHGAVPLTAELSRLHVTVSRRFIEKLEAARAALSHSHPGASDEEILQAGLDLLLERHAKRKGLVAKPQKTVRPSKTDAIPAHVKREAWLRAGGRCEWRFESGERCGSTTRLEFDHHGTPRARGGHPTLENIRVHCRQHNDMGARLAFGDHWMDRYTRKRRRGGSGEP